MVKFGFKTKRKVVIKGRCITLDNLEFFPMRIYSVDLGLGPKTKGEFRLRGT